MDTSSLMRTVRRPRSASGDGADGRRRNSRGGSAVTTQTAQFSASCSPSSVAMAAMPTNKRTSSTASRKLSAVVSTTSEAAVTVTGSSERHFDIASPPHSHHSPASTFPMPSSQITASLFTPPPPFLVASEVATSHFNDLHHGQRTCARGADGGIHIDPPQSAGASAAFAPTTSSASASTLAAESSSPPSTLNLLRENTVATLGMFWKIFYPFPNSIGQLRRRIRRFVAHMIATYAIVGNNLLRFVELMGMVRVREDELLVAGSLDDLDGLGDGMRYDYDE